MVHPADRYHNMSIKRTETFAKRLWLNINYYNGWINSFTPIKWYEDIIRRMNMSPYQKKCKYEKILKRTII